MYKPKILKLKKRNLIVCPSGDLFFDYGNRVEEIKPIIERGGSQRNGRLRFSINSRKISVAQLIATMFLGNSENYIYIKHKDGNILNNSVDNLEWSSSNSFAVEKRKQNHEFYKYLIVIDLSYIDNMIYQYYKFDNEYEIRTWFLNPKINNILKRRFYYYFRHYDNIKLDECYFKLLKSIKNAVFVANEQSEGRLISYFYGIIKYSYYNHLKHKTVAYNEGYLSHNQEDSED